VLLRKTNTAVEFVQCVAAEGRAQVVSRAEPGGFRENRPPARD